MLAKREFFLLLLCVIGLIIVTCKTTEKNVNTIIEITE